MTSTSTDLSERRANDSEGQGALDTMTSGLANTIARMTASLSWLPLGLAVLTAVAFLTEAETPNWDQRVAALFIGAATGLLLWFVLAALTSQLVLPGRANLRSYFDLEARIATLKEDLKRVGSDDESLKRRIGELEVRLSSATLGAAWSSGAAYVAAWRDLHRLEEEFIELEKPEHLEAILVHDELRVDGSTLAKDKERALPQKLIEARAKLSHPTDPGLRPLLREIRYAVDDFRDSAFDNLVRARVTTDRLCVLLGLTTYVLLCVAVLMGASRLDIAVISVVYLVGVAGGLVTRLRGDSSVETTEDIYGYSQANDRQIILLSGLAGIAGVALSSATGATSDADVATKGIAAALGVTPAVFLTAAVSGLAPGLLVDRLNTWAKAKFDDLNSTLPGQNDSK